MSSYRRWGRTPPTPTTARTLIRAELDQARASAADAERIRKANEEIAERARREGR